MVVILKVVTLDVFRENQVQKTSFGCVRTSVRLHERLSRLTASGRPIRLAEAMGRRRLVGLGGRPLVDGLWWIAVRRGRGGRPWWTRRWKTLNRTPSIYFSTSYPLVARVSKSSIGFQGQRANFRCTRP
jgi:hypothetical protein